MSHEIPERFAWDESFRELYEHLDDRRKDVFKDLFAVANDRNDASALSSFVATVTRFLADEEQEGAVIRGGEEFVAYVRNLAIPVSEESIDYAKKWLVNLVKSGDGRRKNKV